MWNESFCLGVGDDVMMMSLPVQDDEGREVALKIDRLDSKKCTPETATKSYIEVKKKIFF